MTRTRCEQSSASSSPRADKGTEGWTDDTGLWGDGLGLDSLEAAELSAMLEDEFGSDPFSAGGDLPERVRRHRGLLRRASATE